MVINQRYLRVGAIVAVAGATGLVMQVQAPEALTLADPAAQQAAPQLAAAAPLVAAELSEALTAETAALLPADPQPAPAAATAELAALVAEPAAVTTSDSPAQSAGLVASDCSADMALVVQPGAMLDLGLISPCRPHQRVVIRHAGLAITGLTSAAGTLIASIPALQSPAEVSISFLDGTLASESAPVPDLARYDRFAIQWHEADAFQLRAYPKGLEVGEAEVIAAATPGTVSEAGGYLLTLGDGAAPRPLFAEVFTWPAAEPALKSAITLSIEAAVTSATCAREILGETLQLSEGTLTLRDFSIEMPDCGAAGEYLALPNPVLGQRVAAN